MEPPNDSLMIDEYTESPHDVPPEDYRRSSSFFSSTGNIGYRRLIPSRSFSLPLSLGMRDRIACDHAAVDRWCRDSRSAKYIPRFFHVRAILEIIACYRGLYNRFRWQGFFWRRKQGVGETRGAVIHGASMSFKRDVRYNNHLKVYSIPPDRKCTRSNKHQPRHASATIHLLWYHLSTLISSARWREP
jgi:hypothetical protein